MKIVSLNLWNGGRLFDQARDFLVSQNADIYLLQEVYNGHGTNLEARFRTADLLRQTFSNYDHFFAPFYLDTRPKEGKIEDGQLMISRRPLSNQQMIWFDVPFGEYDIDAMTDFSNSPAGVQKAQVEFEGKNITLLNVHGPWNLDGLADTTRRQTMRDKLLAEAGEYTIMAGDFNAQTDAPAMRDLGKELVNVFGHNQATSFNLSRKDLDKFPGYATAVVDMMFVTPNLHIISKQMPQVDVSDHLPLVVEVE